MKNGTTYGWLWLILGVPVTFALFVQLGYLLRPGVVPFRGGGEVLFLCVLVGLMLSGALALAKMVRQAWWVRLASASAYIICMTPAVLFTALLVGCFNGDCL